MNDTSPSAPCTAAPGSPAKHPGASVLRQAIDDGVFNGAEIACYGDFAVSWNTDKDTVAIACGSGWLEMPAKDLKAIAAATPGPK